VKNVLCQSKIKGNLIKQAELYRKAN